MSAARYDLMSREVHRRYWQQMSPLRQQQEAAMFICRNAMQCAAVVELLKYPGGENTQQLIDRVMADVAQQFSDTFGLPAPWQP